MEYADFWQAIAAADKDIWLYGMGNGADKILRELARVGVTPKGVFASDGFVRGQQFHGYTVTSYADAIKQSGQFIVLICFGSSRPEVIDNVKHILAEQEVYAPDVPVYGGGLFTYDYVKEHRTQLEQVYHMLADETSKTVFENTVRYKLTGDLRYLFECETDVDEAYALLSLSDQEHYVDLGAYRGDTIEEFLRYTGGYQHIYAVEPDRKTFCKLQDYAGGMDNTTLIHACIADRAGEMPFASRAGRHSSLGGDTLMRAESVDSILGGSKATYIKMDVEGAEALAVAGAKETIIKYKPKMLVSCYHRNEDLFALPLQVFEMRNDYKVYLRRFAGFPAWDMQYYFV